LPGRPYQPCLGRTGLWDSRARQSARDGWEHWQYQEQHKKRKAGNHETAEQTAHNNPRRVKKVRFTKELEPTVPPDSAKQCDTVLGQLGRRVIQGVEIIDIKEGTGLTARNGWRVCIQHVGKLPDGTIFNDSTGGKPYTFIMGAGEVIKGWEVGMEGMW